MAVSSALKILSLSLLLGALTLLSACGGGNTKPVLVSGQIRASNTLNPDIRGEYRPVNVRIYFLKSDAEFKKADFPGVFSRADQILGENLIQMISKQIQPGQELELKENIPEGALYIGVVAAFRDIDNAQWRVSKTLPEKCWNCFGAGLWHPITIKLDTQSVNLSVKE